jgi:NADP-dependent 3-hydroxy acid dehydrogenase YdfG
MGCWLVTGCSTGIGREIARAALESGHNVVVTARRIESVQDLADEFGDRALAIALDVTDKDRRGGRAGEQRRQRVSVGGGGR